MAVSWGLIHFDLARIVISVLHLCLVRSFISYKKTKNMVAIIINFYIYFCSQIRLIKYTTNDIYILYFQTFNHISIIHDIVYTKFRIIQMILIQTYYQWNNKLIQNSLFETPIVWYKKLYWLIVNRILLWNQTTYLLFFNQTSENFL